MTYSDNNRDFTANNAMGKNVQELKELLLIHQNSEECTHSPDCPICKQLNEKIIADGPCLP